MQKQKPAFVFRNLLTYNSRQDLDEPRGLTIPTFWGSGNPHHPPTNGRRQHFGGIARNQKGQARIFGRVFRHFGGASPHFFGCPPTFFWTHPTFFLANLRKLAELFAFVMATFFHLYGHAFAFVWTQFCLIENAILRCRECDLAAW